MADVISLTQDWVVASANNQLQPLYSVVDVLDYDVLDLMLYTGIQLSGALSPILKVSLYTSNQSLSEYGWIPIEDAEQTVTHASSGGGNVTVVKFDTITAGFLRYVRWKVTQFDNIAFAYFNIEGVARKFR